MKKIILFVLAIASIQFSFAQKKISEGKIVYSMKMDGLPEDDPTAAMFTDMSMTLVMKDQMNKVDMNMGMIQIIVFSDLKSKKYTNCMDIMGQKVAIEMSEEEVDAQGSKQKTIKEIKYSDETKKILDYNCKKATVIFEDEGEEQIMPIWYTDELQMAKVPKNDQFQGKIKGLPMEYSMDMNGMNVQIKIESIDLGKVDKNAFDIPSDFEKMTAEEFSKKMGGMMGGSEDSEE